MVKQNKIRRNITVDPYLWEQLPKYISGTRSSFIEMCINKQIYCNDDVDELERQIAELEIQKRNIETEILIKQNKIKELKELRELNNKNRLILEKAMHTIRLVYENESYIDKHRIKFIANRHNIDLNIILEQCKKENIVINQ